MRVRDFKALTFDCYGTLIDWERGLAAVLEPWARRHALDASRDALLEAFAAAEAAAERERPRDPYPEVLRAVHAALAARFRVAAEAAEADRLARSVGAWPPFPDTAAALRQLGERHLLVIVSNVDRGSIAESQRSIGVPFDAVVTAEEVGAYKPDLAMFRRALALLAERGVEPGQVLHVAQSLFHDHVPAKAIGLATAWVDRRRGRGGWGATPPPPTPVTPDLVVPDLATLAAHD